MRSNEELLYGDDDDCISDSWATAKDTVQVVIYIGGTLLINRVLAPQFTEDLGILNKAIIIIGDVALVALTLRVATNAIRCLLKAIARFRHESGVYIGLITHRSSHNATNLAEKKTQKVRRKDGK